MSLTIGNRMLVGSEMFSWYGKILNYFPTAVWLHFICSDLNRLSSDGGCDDNLPEVNKATEKRVLMKDPLGGFWKMDTDVGREFLYRKWEVDSEEEGH